MDFWNLLIVCGRIQNCAKNLEPMPGATPKKVFRSKGLSIVLKSLYNACLNN